MTTESIIYSNRVTWCNSDQKFEDSFCCCWLSFILRCRRIAFGSLLVSSILYLLTKWSSENNLLEKSCSKNRKSCVALIRITPHGVIWITPVQTTIPIFSHLLHSKKIGFLLNHQKRFRRFLKASKGAQSLKKRIKKSTKPLKVLPVYQGEEPFKSETFLSSVEQKKVS